MQKTRKAESNLARKWWYMDHEGIPKMVVQKIKAHASNESHIRHLEAELTPKKGGSKWYVHQL